MTAALGWEESFLAMSVAVGETRDGALGMLTPLPPGRATALAQLLARSTKVARVEALAEALGGVMRDVVAMEVA